MHELQLVADLLSMAEREARLAGIGKINRLVISVGELVGVDSSGFLFCFEQVRRHYPSLQSADLEFRINPVKVSCALCGECFQGISFICPGCGGKDLSFTEGDGIYLECLEGEENQGDQY